jgi:hypothetical protein
MASAAAGLLAPRVTFVLSLTVETVDSIVISSSDASWLSGLEVRGVDSVFDVAV